MRTEKIIWGLILVFVGGILLLQNFGVIDFQWQVIFRFWPVILILIGANLLFSRDDSRSGAAILILLTLLVLGFITYKGITSIDEESEWSFRNDRDDNERIESGHIFIEEYNDSIAKAVLNISGGATKYILKDTSTNLFQADVRKSFGNYSLLKTFSDSTQILDFKMKGNSQWEFKRNHGNTAILKLNPNPIWDISVEMGAGTANLDLSLFKIDKLSIKGGAASFKVKLPAPIKATAVSVETGVSEMEISIPRSAACKITTESGLSSSDFKGFKKQSDGTYTNENYESAYNAIDLNLKGGLSKFKVLQY